MSSTSSQSTISQGAAKSFQFAILQREPFIIKAQLSDSDYESSHPTDLQFNLSAVLGNNDGEFAWGRTAFQKTGTDFTLDKSTGVLKGKLLSLEGIYRSATINLRDRLYVESYVDPRITTPPIPHWRHKLKEAKPLKSVCGCLRVSY